MPVLLTKQVKKAMLLLVEKREAVEINPRNPTFLQGQVAARLATCVLATGCIE